MHNPDNPFERLDGELGDEDPGEGWYEELAQRLWQEREQETEQLAIDQAAADEHAAQREANKLDPNRGSGAHISSAMRASIRQAGLPQITDLPPSGEERSADEQQDGSNEVRQ